MTSLEAITQWRHSNGLDIPVIDIDGDSWVPAALFAQSVGMTRQRINAALRRAGLATMQAMGHLCFRLAELPAVAGCIKPGTNNKLLLLRKVAIDVAANRDSDPLRQKAEKNKQAQLTLEQLRQWQAKQLKAEYEAMQTAIAKAKAGVPIAQIYPDWHAVTGKAQSTLYNALTGHGSRLAQAALHTSSSTGGLQLSPSAPFKGGGRPAKLTAPVLLEIRRKSQQGASIANLAKEYGTLQQIIRDIVQGIYATKAMKEALLLEQGNASSQPP